MKPRLKLNLSGAPRLSVICPGQSPRPESDTRRELMRRHGGLRGFAERFCFSYAAVTAAFGNAAHKRAGEPHHIRLVLGLETSPTVRSQKAVARLHQSKRGEPEWVFGVQEAGQ